MATRNEQADALAKRMVTEAQVPPYQAMAMALALVFAVEHPEFAEKYGTFTQEHLDTVINRLLTEP